MDYDRPGPDRDALRALLQTHRSRLDPADFGFGHAAGPGRRTIGLNQRQVDTLTGLYEGACYRLESGRYHNPPIDYLERIGHLYSLTETEWVALNQYTRGVDPPAPLNAHTGLTLPAEWRDAVEGITHMAYVGNRRWDVLAHNEAFPSMFPGRRVPRNTMRWLLLDRPARGVLTDWATAWAPEVATKLRATRLALPNDPVLAQIEADVLADPDAGPIYKRASDVRIHSDGIARPFLHPEWGPGWLTMCSAEPLSSPRAQIMILPFDTDRPPDRPPLRA